METSFDFPEFADEAEQPVEAVELTVDQVELVVSNLDLVNAIAHAVYRKISGINTGISVEDLAQQGSIGLIQAAQRYSKRGASFQTFAGVRIKGEMLDYLRNNLPNSRFMQQKTKQWIEALNLLREELKTEPTTEEIAARLGISDREEIDEIRMALMNFTPMSLSDSINVDGESPMELSDLVDDPNAEFADKVVLGLSISHALSQTRLLERERIAIEQHFFEDVTMVEIGKGLGVVESRVSQLVAKGLQRIREAHPTISDSEPLKSQRRAA